MYALHHALMMKRHADDAHTAFLPFSLSLAARGGQSSLLAEWLSTYVMSFSLSMICDD